METLKNTPYSQSLLKDTNVFLSLPLRFMASRLLHWSKLTNFVSKRYVSIADIAERVITTTSVDNKHLNLTGLRLKCRVNEQMLQLERKKKLTNYAT